MENNVNQFVGVKKSKKHGDGLFALKDFKKGEEMYVYKKGKTVDYDEVKNLSDLENGKAL